MFQMMRNWYSRWSADLSRAHELDGCSSFDLDRIAHDLGMSVSELRQVTASGRTDLLFARLRERKIDPGEIDPAVLRDLQRCCGACANKTLCAHELEDRPIEARWPAYCPNQVTIEALTAMKCH